jgi:hypothetical protein
VVEHCWTLLGERRGRIWCCRRVRRTQGERAQLCLIAGPDGLRGYRFDNAESAGEALAVVELFPGGLVIGVDADG